MDLQSETGPKDFRQGRSGYPWHQSGQAWTSSRCRRLLRPLQTRLFTLRKITIAENTGLDQHLRQGTTDTEAAEPPAKRLKARDNIGRTEGQGRRLQRTYSRKTSPGVSNGNKPPTKAPARPRQKTPTALAVPNVSTPILRKVRHCDTEGTSAGSQMCDGVGGLIIPSTTVRRGRLDMALNKLERMRHLYSQPKYQLYEGILHDLDALLRATSAKWDTGGSKSLLSMCLRKVPCYAAEVEAWERLNTVNRGPVSSIEKASYSLGVYDDLEALGGAGNGWGHLRTLLRAHSVSLLQEAITEGLMDSAFGRILVDHLKAIGCHRESGELMEALLGMSCPSSTRRYADEILGGVTLSLLDMAGDSGVTAHLFETISSLLLCKRLHVGALSTKALGLFWSKSASSILDLPPNPSAIRFASTGLGLLSICSFAKHTRRTRLSKTFGPRDFPAEKTLASVLGALSAMALISQGFGGVGEVQEPVPEKTRTRRLVSQIMQEALALVSREGGGSQTTYPLLLALFLSTGLADVDGCTNITVATAALFTGEGGARYAASAGQRQLYNTTVDLICSIAHCCGRATGQPSSHYFDELCKLVGRLGNPELASLRSDGAFVLAQKTDDLRDLVFAEALTEAPVTGGTVKRPSRTSETLFSGYRWEEGISEWIAISPTANRRSVVVQVAARPRRAGRDSDGSREIAPLCWAGPEPASTASGAADQSQRAVERHQVDRQRGGSRGSHDERRDAVDELSATCQENRPRGLDKSRLGSTASRSQGGSRRLVRIGETGHRKVLAELGIAGNMTGHSDDDDELGL